MPWPPSTWASSVASGGAAEVNEFMARVRALAGNRWAMAGLAGAAGLGVYALVRRGGSSGGASAPAASSGEAAAFTAPSTYPNSYATDLAAAVGELDSRYAEDLAEFSGQLGSDIDALEAMQKKQGGQVADVTKSVAALKAASKAPAKTTGRTGTKPKPKKPTSSTAGKGWASITIRRGDTLGALAAKYHTSVGALVKANNIADPNLIRAGAKLKVPG